MQEAADLERAKARRRTCALAFALLLLVAAAWWRAAGCGFIWDDDLRVTRNAALRSGAGLASIWLEPGATKQYYPLVFSSFWLEWQLWGDAPAGYHIVNVALHAAASLLLWRLLAALAVPGAWAAAALFALHPVHVESVAWISERKNVLSAVFYLGAALALVPALGLGGGARRRPGRGPWLLAFALFVCALCSKTVTASLPAAALLVLWWKRGRIGRADLVPLLPFFVAGAALGLLTAWLERVEVGASGALFDLEPAQRVLIAGRALWFYLGKLAWPHPLSFNYPRWDVDVDALAQWAWPLAALALTGLLWAARWHPRVGRAPLTAWLFFAGTLFPALGFIDVYPMRFAFVADHFQYLASIGPIAFVCAAATLAARRRAPLGPRLASLVLAGVLAVYAALVYRQLPNYDGLEPLWRATLEVNPHSALAHLNLGNLVRRRGEREEAERHYRAALAADPFAPEPHNQLGALLAKGGRVDAALPHLRRAVELEPGYAVARLNLAVAYEERGELDAALAQLELAAALAPERASLRRALARVLAQLGQREEAHAHSVEANRLERLNRAERLERPR